MENPATWDEVTQLIDKVITEWQKSQAEGEIGRSLPKAIRDALDEANLLLLS
jgi:hypothetical protein